MRKLELMGKRFERLTVILKLENNKKGNTQWLCACDCGKTIKSTGTDLTTGRKPSCGCRKSELISEARKLPTGEAAQNSLFAQYKKSARERNIEFNLNLEEFKSLIDKNCHYCGDISTLKVYGDARLESKGANGNFIYTGIDRKDSNLGYELYNCLTCCKTCNFAKNDMSYDEFMTYLGRLVKFRS